MGHLAGFHAVADGKRHANKGYRTAKPTLQRLSAAAATLVAALAFSSASYAQAGPFAGMAGVWSGGGTVTLDDGSTERIRCRATYAVGSGGNGLNQSLTCAATATVQSCEQCRLEWRSLRNVDRKAGALTESPRDAQPTEPSGHRQRTGV